MEKLLFDIKIKAPKLPKIEIETMLFNTLFNFKSFSDFRWLVIGILKLNLYKKEIYQITKGKTPYGISLTLDEIYKQIDNFTHAVLDKSKSMSIEEAFVYHLKDLYLKYQKKSTYNIFVPDPNRFDDSLARLNDNIVETQSRVNKYKFIFTATIDEVDEMDAKTFKYFLMLLYLKKGYSIEMIKQKNMFYVSKENKKYIIQGKLGKITHSALTKLYDSSPKDYPFIIVNNGVNQIDTSFNVLYRKELEQYITETKKLLDYSYIDNQFVVEILDNLHHVLNVSNQRG